MSHSLTIIDHPSRAAAFVKNDVRSHWHDETLWFVRVKRDRAAQSLPEWEQLRETASEIKANVGSHLAEYLEQFEQNANRLGVKVHWARDAAEHNAIVLGILQQHGVKKVVKSKSMLTEECHLNPFLERHGMEVIDTDLGERIVQMANEPPSHIVLPCIHWKREEIGELFHQQLGTDKGAIDPKLHIACMGIEKLIPRAADLGVFLRLLARSATGQPITSYSSHFHGPSAGGELHIVLVDNGRSAILGREEFRRSLNCIRCGACMNTCPVYRRSGGHSYGNAVPGPIGSILAPSSDPKKYKTLPSACSLCASCTDVCPVKIDLHNQLLTWRHELARIGLLSWSKRFAMKMAAFVFRHPRLYGVLGKTARVALSILPRWMIYNSLNPWGKQRELPPVPKSSFRKLFRERQAK